MLPPQCVVKKPDNVSHASENVRTKHREKDAAKKARKTSLTSKKECHLTVVDGTGQGGKGNSPGLSSRTYRGKREPKPSDENTKEKKNTQEKPGGDSVSQTAGSVLRVRRQIQLLNTERLTEEKSVVGRNSATER